MARERPELIGLPGLGETNFIFRFGMTNDENFHKLGPMSKSEPVSEHFAKLMREAICHRLNIDNFTFVEIESKKRILPHQVKEFKKYLHKRKKVKHLKTTVSLDQFLDTPRMDLFKKGASLRLRYKRNGSDVYLQYKGPGFLEQGLLYRSEFSSQRLRHVLLDESHHDAIHFSHASIGPLLLRRVPAPMRQAMKRHLGAEILESITAAPVICSYQKEKFIVDFGPAFLEPSIDRVFAFHINGSGPHAVSTFWEYENEIKTHAKASLAKIELLPELLRFEEKLSEEFDLKAERLDKYHRCASLSFPRR